MKKPRRTKKELFEEGMHKAAKRHLNHELAYWFYNEETGKKETRVGKFLRFGNNEHDSLVAFLEVNKPFPEKVYFADLQSCRCGKNFVFCDKKGHWFQDGEASPCECGMYENAEEARTLLNKKEKP